MITKYLCVLALFSLTMYTYSKRMVKNLRGQRVCVCVCSSFITLPSSRSDNNFVLCDHTKELCYSATFVWMNMRCEIR